MSQVFDIKNNTAVEPQIVDVFFPPRANVERLLFY